MLHITVGLDAGLVLVKAHVRVQPGHAHIDAGLAFDVARVALAKARLKEYVWGEFDHIDVVVLAAGHGVGRVVATIMGCPRSGRLWLEVDAIRARYFDLYDLAPVGYCTLSEKGLILEVNLTAANLLGVTRQKLINQPHSRFILTADQDIYYLHRKKLLDLGEAQSCELRIVKSDGIPFWTHVVATDAQDADGAVVHRVVLSDISDLKRMEVDLLTRNTELEGAKRVADKANPANLQLVEELVARLPHVRLLTAEDALQGIALARAHQPDVILMDINLPGINGLEALKILQGDATTRHIPVMALSANAMPGDVAQGLQAGFFRYVTKPIRITEFMVVLDHALEFAQEQAVRGNQEAASL